MFTLLYFLFLILLSDPIQAYEEQQLISFTGSSITNNNNNKKVKIKLRDDEFWNLSTAPVPDLRIEQFLFLHPGKSGGGTFLSRLKIWWKLGMKECHPHPCNEHIEDKTVFITIRDPIDRFVSAFNWRRLIYCNPDGDSRKHFDRIPNGVKTSCYETDYDRYENEINVLYHKYKQDVSKLAEALCSRNEEEKRQAEEDVASIGHMQHSIMDWLGNDKNLNKVIPVVLDEHVDFNKQIDEAIQYAQQQYHFEDSSNFQKRKEMVLAKDAQEKDERLKDYVKSLTHSSSRIKQHSLSQSGKKCLASYYAKDYSLIQTLKMKSCKTINCRQALQSILDKHMRLLKS